MRRYFIASLLLFPLLIGAYVSPGKPTGFVNDFASLLSQQTVIELNNELTNFEKETGAEISVVTINNLGDETIETYAEKLFQEWGIGKAKQDNGILLLISKEDREMRIEVGYGLEPIITDIESSHIINEILVPNFQNVNFDSGVKGALGQIEKDIRNGGPEFSSPSQENDSTPLWNFIPYVIFALMYFASVLSRSKSWWAGGMVGGVIGVIISLIKGFLFLGLISLVILIPFGLLFDFLVSKSYLKHKTNGTNPPWWIGGGSHGSGRGGFGGGGFGGFGGGMSGGGGASGRW